MTTEVQTFNRARALRMGMFQLGSAMGDILVTSIWNRILISNFGIPAGPVSLLIALRYFMFPLSLLAGHWSDNKLIAGLRRTPLIWTGRLMMILALPLLGLSVTRLGQSTTDVLGWLSALLSTLMYGIGTLISGSPYLALVRSSAPESKQGMALSIVETMLIIFFAITGISFSLMMEEYTLERFWQLIILTMIVGGFLWFFSIVGIEKRMRPEDLPAAARDGEGSPLSGFGAVLREIWSDRRTRLFFIFLSLSTLSAWAKDAILEPYGADVFDMAVGTTTRFNSYWQAMTVITLLSSFAIWRKRPSELVGPVASVGLMVMALGIALLGVAGLTGRGALVIPGLLIFGAGFGFYTFGGFSLMAVMSPDRHAGAYLGLWTISVLVSKGLGTLLGGATRDLFLLGLGLPAGFSYATVFFLQAVGLATSALILSRIDVPGFARETGRKVSLVEAQIAAAD